MAYIEVKNVNKHYDELRVLNNISLEVQKNEFVTLLGPSGGGKTTLLRSIAGLESVDSGSIILDSDDITHRHPRDRQIAMIFQNYCLFPTMRVFDNVAYGLKIKKMDREAIETEVMNALETVGLSSKTKNYPSELSGGERQRVALARSLVMKPKVLLLDEPFNAIDAKLRKSLQLIVKRLHKEYNMTSIMVTHDQEEAMRMSDTIHLFRNGSIEQSGRPTDLYIHPKTEYVASFMGHYNIFKPEVFRRITEGRYADNKTVAIRPEAFEIELSTSNTANSEGNYGFEFKGLIVGIIAQGNVSRLSVEVRGEQLDVDVIIDRVLQFSLQAEVRLRVRAENVLYYE